MHEEPWQDEPVQPVQDEDLWCLPNSPPRNPPLFLRPPKKCPPPLHELPVQPVQLETTTVPPPQPVQLLLRPNPISSPPVVIAIIITIVYIAASPLSCVKIQTVPSIRPQTTPETNPRRPTSCCADQPQCNRRAC